MKVTKNYLKHVIKEELERLREVEEKDLVGPGYIRGSETRKQGTMHSDVKAHVGMMNNPSGAPAEIPEVFPVVFNRPFTTYNSQLKKISLQPGIQYGAEKQKDNSFIITAGMNRGTPLFKVSLERLLQLPIDDDTKQSFTQYHSKN